MGDFPKVSNFNRLFLKDMPQSHQTFHSVPTVKLLGIMFKNRCWSIDFHTISAGDDGWTVPEVVGVIGPSTRSSGTSGWFSPFIVPRGRANQMREVLILVTLTLGEITPSYILHTRAFGTYLFRGLFTLQKI
jgi:hypothetical protein